jgi:hypothetical protein
VTRSPDRVTLAGQQPVCSISSEPNELLITLAVSRPLLFCGVTAPSCSTSSMPAAFTPVMVSVRACAGWAPPAGKFTSGHGEMTVMFWTDVGMFLPAPVMETLLGWLLPPPGSSTVMDEFGKRVVKVPKPKLVVKVGPMVTVPPGLILRGTLSPPWSPRRTSSPPVVRPETMVMAPARSWRDSRVSRLMSRRRRRALAIRSWWCLVARRRRLDWSGRRREIHVMVEAPWEGRALSR